MICQFNQNKSNVYTERREFVFLIIAGFFLGTLCLLNVVGLSHTLDFSFTFNSWSIPVVLPLGILPFPVTFICIDLICELYGRKRANQVVWVGLLINIWIFVVMWLGGVLPAHTPIDPTTNFPSPSHPSYAFFMVRSTSMGSTLASMVAYMVSQLLDVYLFQYWNKKTQGRHLWLRINFANAVSQFFDTIIVLSLGYLITSGLSYHASVINKAQLLIQIGSSYSLKILFTLVATLPFYVSVFYLRKYFGMEPTKLKSYPELQLVKVVNSLRA